MHHISMVEVWQPSPGAAGTSVLRGTTFDRAKYRSLSLVIRVTRLLTAGCRPIIRVCSRPV